MKLQRNRAVDIADTIVLSELGGQGYDGASTMTGAKGGGIKQQQPKAIYTHCAGHSFN